MSETDTVGSVTNVSEASYLLFLVSQIQCSGCLLTIIFNLTLLFNHAVYGGHRIGSDWETISQSNRQQSRLGGSVTFPNTGMF